MRVPKLTFAFVLAASVAAAQEPNPQAMQMQVQKIAQERPREAEAAARAFIMLIAPDRVEGNGSLDSLKARSLDQYWMEVAQLTVQFEMVQNLNRRDSVRAGLVARMFGLEVNARALQRVYRAIAQLQTSGPIVYIDGVRVDRGSADAQRGQIRTQLESLIGQHFDIEDRLRGLEVADIERRLVDVRAETQRRREKRVELVKWAVDDIIRDATRPQ
jgi:hypothetical protein